MKQTKIVHFITGLGVGGAEMMLLKTLPRMSKNFENIVVSGSYGEIADKLKEKGITVYLLAEKHQTVSFVQMVKKFKEIIKKEKPDVLTTYLIHADLFGRFFGRLFGVKKVICSERGSLVRWWYLRIVDRLTSFLVTRYICVSKTLAGQLTRIWKVNPCKVDVIPNGVVIENFSFKINKDKKRKSLKLKNTDFVISYTANLREGKGHKYLLEAIHHLKKHHRTLQDHLKLLLVGAEQGEEKLIKRLIKKFDLQKDVMLLGYRTDVLEILKISDVFAFPSESEGMSNALLEALASGCTIVASDINENAEVVDNNKTGLLFKTKSYESLLEKLELLYTDKKLRTKLAKNAKTAAEKNFNITTNVKRLERIYKKIQS